MFPILIPIMDRSKLISTLCQITFKRNCALKSAKYPVRGCAFSNLLYFNNTDSPRRCLTVPRFKEFSCLSWKCLNFFSWSCLFSFQQKDCKNVSGAKRFHRDPYQLQFSAIGHNSSHITSVNHIPMNFDQCKAMWGWV